MKLRKFTARLILVSGCLTLLFSMAPALAAGSYQWPVPASKTVTQAYKAGSHTGIDIGGAQGSQVVATKAGTVVYVYTGCVNQNAAKSGNKDCAAAGCSPNCGTYTKSGKKICNWGYGNGVIIQHADGSGYSMYAHMKTVSVRKGDTVAQGAALGTLGSSGYSTGAHLHFELTATVDKRGTYYEPTAPINSNTSSIAYTDTPQTTPPAAVSVSFSKATDPNYTSKQALSDTNAVVVTQVNKSAGVSVTQMGLYLYDASGKQIKRYVENISNVGVNTTKYHSWYNINSEVGVTLTPGTTYQYRFFGVFNGVEKQGSLFSFTTTGQAPIKQFRVTFMVGGSSVAIRTVTQGQACGELPAVQSIPDGYVVDGWYTAQEGGTKVSASTIFSGNSDVTLYLRLKAIEPERYTVSFYDNTSGGTIVASRTVVNGQTYDLPADPTRAGYRFTGWYTADGHPVTSSTTVSLQADQALYAHWEEQTTVWDITLSSYPKDDQGMVELSDTQAEEGTWVTIRIRENERYAFVELSAKTESGDAILVREYSGKVFRFVMPDEPVQVYAEFEEKDTQCDGGSGCPSRSMWDVRVSDWFHPAVDYMVENGMMNGTSATTFAPLASVTRGMMAQILYNMEGLPMTSSPYFSDVALDAWYADAVGWVSAWDIMNGYGDSRFGPEDGVTREQIATILYQYASYKNYTQSSSGNLSAYRDAGQVSSWAQPAMRWAVYHGLISGTTSTTLSPQNIATRAEVAQILMTFCENVAK
ncbi:MAG: S-layer homology domain-containing protein [Butyricicoccus sp.]|nr:S-layer homology domain-containing protein [Butyricicoccus sp.]